MTPIEHSWRNGLRLRIVGLAMLTVILTALGVSLFALWSSSASERHGLENHGTAMAAMLAQNTDYVLYTRDANAASQLLDGIDADRTLDYAAIVAADGTVLHAATSADAPARLPAIVGPVGSGSAVWIDQDGARWFDVVVPVSAAAGEDGSATVLGHIRLLLSDRSLRANARRTLLATLSVALLVIVLGAVVATLLSQRIVGPLRDLADATVRVGEGQLTPVTVRGRDEVSVLARSFNDMISQLAASRAEVRASQENLEARVIERTEQLQRATEEAHRLALAAEAGARAKMQFLANMSHEIRTPMNAVLGLSELLRTGPLPPNEQALAETIHTSAKGLLTLLSDILDVSKAEAGQVHLERAAVDLRGVVGSVVSLVAHDARKKGLQIGATVDPRIRWVCGDETRLRQILLNLVNNAVKFTARGQIDLRVQRLDGPRVQFEVQDTGIGIPAAQQERVFEPFVQADESTTRRFGGTGLGLAISRQLVALMGGEIILESKEGVGTCVRFVVPLEPVAAEARPETVTEARPAARRRILVVEDNPFNQVVAQQLLTHIGHQVEIAPSGADALACLRERSYDLVFMDCQMPEMDGYESAAEVRRLEARTGVSRVPIIALTAHAMPEDRRRALEAGMDGYVTKPFTMAQLAATIDEFARQTPVLTPPAPAPEPLAAPLVELFAKSAAELIGRMEDADLRQDSRALANAAHALKGSAAQAGAVELSRLAGALEKAALMGASGPNPAIGRLQSELKDALGELRAAQTETPFPAERTLPVDQASRPTVLLVDDEPLVRATIRAMLASTFDVLEAQDGTDAVALVSQVRPAVILLDLQMPGMGGIEACGRIRALPEGARIPIIMLTGADDPLSIDRSYQAGATDFFTKPVRSRLLLQRVWNIHRAAEAVQEAESRRIAAEEARKANAAKSLFLASMSHELRTPLNAVLGYAEMIAEQTEAPSLVEIHQDAVRIERAGRHLLSLLNDVLDLAKVQAGRLQLLVEPFDLDTLLAELCEQGRVLGEQHGNRMELADPVRLTMRSERRRVYQVLMNLVGNAAKFTQDGVIRLSARQEGEKVVIDVEDTGIGIEPAALANLFEPFAQANAQIQEQHGGTGLGLALSRDLCRALGGDLFVASTPGVGSRFTARLPIELPATGATAEELRMNREAMGA